MALKKRDVDADYRVRDEEKEARYSAEPEKDTDVLIDKNTGKPFPEAPRDRQGDGVLTGEVPTGFNDEKK